MALKFKKKSKKNWILNETINKVFINLFKVRFSQFPVCSGM